MFDSDTSALIAGTPELEGLNLSKLPDQLTDAYASIVTARVRLRELEAGKPLPDDIEALTMQMRKIAFTNEAFVSALPNRENRASAAFVAGAAHHVSLMAARMGRTEKPETRLTLDSIAPEVSATLLFMIAEATADSAEMAKEIVIQVSHDREKSRRRSLSEILCVRHNIPPKEFSCLAISRQPQRAAKRRCRNCLLYTSPSPRD